MAPFSIPKNLSFISVAEHWLKISVKYRWLFVCVFFLSNGTAGRVIPPTDTSAVVKELQDRPAYVVEQKETQQEKLENMLGDMGITEQVYYAQLPQNRGRGGSRNPSSWRHLMFSDDPQIGMLARQMSEGNVDSRGYHTAARMLGEYGHNTSEFSMAYKVVREGTTPLDTLVSELEPEEKMKAEINIIKYDIDDLEGSQPPDVEQIISKYKQLIELEPTYENYKGILEYAKGPPNSSVDDFIKYSQKAIELSPTKEEKLENMGDFADSLVNLYLHTTHDKAHIDIAISVVEAAVELDPKNQNQYKKGIKYMQDLKVNY